MKVLNEAETALVFAAIMKGEAIIKYARLDNHEGAEYVYITVKSNKAESLTTDNLRYD
jgi:hypothetical protein